jgi:hypothetical protein
VRSPCPSLLQLHVQGAQSAALAFVFGARATAVGAVQLVVGPGAGASHCFSRALCAYVLEKLRVGRGTCLLAHRQPCTACIGFQLPKANAVLAKEKRSCRPAERVKKIKFREKSELSGAGTALAITVNNRELLNNRLFSVCAEKMAPNSIRK